MLEAHAVVLADLECKVTIIVRMSARSSIAFTDRNLVSGSGKLTVRRWRGCILRSSRLFFRCVISCIDFRICVVHGFAVTTSFGLETGNSPFSCNVEQMLAMTFL